MSSVVSTFPNFPLATISSTTISLPPLGQGSFYLAGGALLADIILVLLPIAVIPHYHEPVHILSFDCFFISVLFVGTAKHN